VEVFMPHSFPAEFKAEIETAGARYREVTDASVVCGGAHTTGELVNTMREQSLVLETSHGLVVITGCAHPGIVEILEAVKRSFDDSIYLVAGGFHLFDKSEEEIGRIIDQIRELGVKKAAPAHCTGDKAIGLFELAYGEDFVGLGAGARLKVE
jgi:7,8-dihydropterin-6-yl-methyl-4-(beta-D-ribofuranosyl)aminobenzene 5'-phosphate synthase